MKELAREAEDATRAENLPSALEAWRSALELLPPRSRQAAQVNARIQALSARVDRGEGRTEQSGRKPVASRSWKAGVSTLGVIGLLLWKFKVVLLFLVTKGKLLLLGLTKSGTLLSMVLSLGVYWAVWGWRFALGLVLSIYVHEMGHVAALRRFGIKASAPTFIPGLGAIVRLKQYPANAIEDARVGLAGPLWGLGAAFFCYGVFLVTDSAFWGAIASVGAWINLFNLLPVAPLDGGRGFRAMSRAHRWIAVAALAVMWFVTTEGLLLLLLVAAVIQTFAPPPQLEGRERVAVTQYVALVVLLSLLTAIPVPIEAALSR